MISIPWPGSLRTSRLPPRDWAYVLTASRPTPRPARSVTCSAVEYPARASTSAREPSRRASSRTSGETHPPTPPPHHAPPTDPAPARRPPRLLDNLRRDASAVVRDHDLDEVAPRHGADLDATTRRLARAHTLLRGLDAMVDGVAQQVPERLGQGLQDDPVTLA